MNKNTSCNLSEINEEYLVTYLSKLFYKRGIDSNKVKGPSKTKYNIWNDISLHIFNEFSYLMLPCEVSNPVVSLSLTSLGSKISDFA